MWAIDLLGGGLNAFSLVIISVSLKAPACVNLWQVQCSLFFFLKPLFFSHFPQWCLTLRFRKNKQIKVKRCAEAQPLLSQQSAWRQIKHGSMYSSKLVWETSADSHFTDLFFSAFSSNIFSGLSRHPLLILHTFESSFIYLYAVAYALLNMCFMIVFIPVSSFSCLSQVCSVNPTMKMSRCSALVWISQSEISF